MKCAAFLLATAFASEGLIVSLTSSAVATERGDSATYTCRWELDDDADDYQEDDFIMYWKLKYEEDEEETIYSYSPTRSSPVSDYLTHKFNQRSNLTYDFDDSAVTLEVDDLDISDDGVEISCEVHWNIKYSSDEVLVGVFVNAEVDLDVLDNTLEGRTMSDNGTIIEPEETEVATCKVSGVFPEPETVSFLVGGETIEVAEDIIVEENDDGTFEASATLALFPDGSYNGDEVTCFSLARQGAETQHSEANDTFTLEVTYYTNEVDLVLTGDAEEAGDDSYYVTEGNFYSVSCQANGNPPAQVTITNADGVEIVSGTSIAAERGQTAQTITCTATNNEELFDQGEAQVDDAELDVYYIDAPTLGDDVTAQYDEEFTVACNVQGHPTPQVQWTKGASDEVVDTDSLELGALKYDDAGEYTCTATNAAGSESDSFDLSVNGPCIVEIIDVTAGQSPDIEAAASLALSCRVQGPNCEISWESEIEGLINQGDTTFLEEDNISNLYFTQFVTLNEESTFTCKASNEEGPRSDSIEVTNEHYPACCQDIGVGGLGTGAIVGIVIAIPAILIIIGAAVFFCRKRGEDKNVVDEGDAEEPEKEPLQGQPEHDGEGGNAGDDAV